MKMPFQVVLLCAILSAATANAATYLYFNSEPGDYIGQGREQTLTDEDGVFTATTNYDNGVSIRYNGTTWWNLNFAAPNEEQLQPGPYEDATRFPFQSPTEPGLDVSGDGRGCNKLTGRFDILEISYNADGEIDRFAADFEQHCEGVDPALYGSIRINSTVGFPAKVDIEANGHDTPIIVKVGEPVTIKVNVDAGDDEGVTGEYWLGKSGTYGSQWFNGTKWVPKYILPIPWKSQPIAPEEFSFKWVPRAPGVQMFQIVIDEKVDGRLDTRFVDHVVITVVKNNIEPTSLK